MSDTDSTQPGGAQDANLVASPDGVQPNSVDLARLKQEWKAEVLAELRGDKTLTQSMKDQVIAGVKNDKGFRHFLDEYKALRGQGYNDTDIERELRLRDLEARTVQPASNAGGSRVDTESSELEALLPALGLAADDPDVLRVSASPLGFGAKAAALVQVAQRKNTPPNPAAVSQPPSAPPPPVNPKVLEGEYKSKALAAKGNKALVRAIQNEYRAKGLAVEGIDLTAP